MGARFLVRFDPRLGDAPDDGRRPAPPGMVEPRRRMPGLEIFVDPAAQPMVSPCGGGAVIGALFRRGDNAEVRTLDRNAVDEAKATRCRSFVEDYWGRYVLVLRRGDGGVTVLRDPSGAAPAYHFRDGDALVFCSDAATAAGAHPPARRADPEFVRQWLTYPYLRTARTALAGVRELLPGTALHASESAGRVEVVWNPWDHAAAAAQITDFDEATARLRSALLDTIPLHFGARERILLQLSGGLDSSIVAMALARSSRSFEAVTYHTRSPDGDERRYARRIAETCAVRLAELLEDDRPLDLSATSRAGFRPGPNPVLQPLRLAQQEHGRTVAADVIADGAGGDNLFCYLTTAAPAVDAARRRGVLAATPVLGDIANVTGSTIWAVAKAAWRKHRTAASRPIWRRDERFLAKGAAAAAPDHHPWLEAAGPALPGKREHVEALVNIRHFIDLDDAAAALRPAHPLLSQPLIELCLGIPTWLWVRGGRDRAVARAAFATLLPPAILNRRGKGRLESVFVKTYAASRDALRALLLEGYLRREGLLDHDMVDLYLRQDGDPQDDAYIRLFEFAALELWLRSTDR